MHRAHQYASLAVKTDLQRLRELTVMTKPELIDYIVRVENSLATLSDHIDHAYGDETVTGPSYACKFCGNEYPSVPRRHPLRGPLMDACRPVRAVMRPAAFSEDD